MQPQARSTREKKKQKEKMMKKHLITAALVLAGAFIGVALAGYKDARTPAEVPAS
jgi:hypothetical protein